MMSKADGFTLKDRHHFLWQGKIAVKKLSRQQHLPQSSKSIRNDFDFSKRVDVCKHI